MVLKRHNGNSWHSTDRIWAASDTRRHMHVGKRPCAPLRCDDAAEMQVEGLDALENAAGPDCPRLAQQMLSEKPYNR
jgi:hypothetical protein